MIFLQIQHKIKNPAVFGTLLLTVSGILGKTIGFFYKIFLSRTIGAKGLGIYQLIFPISSICFAVTAAGLSTALTKYVAEYKEQDSSAPRRFLSAGISASLALSLFCTLLLRRNADFIAENILLEPLCAPLIRILAWSVPLSAVHSCIHGYYYGKKKALIPALSSLIEQLIRIFSVFLLCNISSEQNTVPNASAAVWGLVFGEGGAFLFCVTSLFFEHKKKQPSAAPSAVRHAGAKLFAYAAPLSMNRLALTLFASFESILIPSRLHLFGYTQSDALSIYGVLTGMALSVLMFPSVFTNAVSVMLLPVISEADAKKDTARIAYLVRLVIYGCLLLGSLCTIAFLLTGKWIGNFLFANSLAGKFIFMLSFICPFLFLNSLLSSILHGLGKTSYPFLLNLLGNAIRTAFVYFLVPLYGLKAYLIGMLLSQMIVSVCYVGILKKTLS